jgi:16S rRNA (guanine(527)-N(7))-methyltransferase RsmG
LDFKDLLVSEFAPYGKLSEGQADALERHYSSLIRWNQRMNLTRIEKVEDAVRLHYCESLFLAKMLPQGPLRIGDLGSGAGFPGYPVAVLRPECQVDLIESHQRKAVFLREATEGLGNARVIAARAESVSNVYDWLISRAVSPNEVLALRRALNVALLMGVRDVNSLGTKPDSIVESPWGTGHVVCLFHVKHPKGE